MGKVKILSRDVYSKIQAGEIIEGPNSVVRELIDNSIDAGSKNIVVELIKSGFEAIVVKDDGEGILKEDLKIVFKNHATSKIEKARDLKFISTLGFRGEALYSIASVSRVIIKSKVKEEDSGYMIKVYGGKEVEFLPVPMNNGTIVNVQDLFFNVPVRRKFFNSVKRELSIIKKLFLNKAASSYWISFTLINNGKMIYNYGCTDSFFERIKNIIGNTTYNNLKKVDLDYIENVEGELIKKYGIEEFKILFSSKDFYSKYRAFFLIIINGRPVIEDELIKKVRSFYYSYLPRGFYPYFIINIKMDPSYLDQNIDPTKNKVKIENPQYFSERLIGIVKRYLDSDILIRDIEHSFDNDLRDNKNNEMVKNNKNILIKDLEENTKFDINVEKNSRSEIEEERKLYYYEDRKYDIIKNGDSHPLFGNGYGVDRSLSLYSKDFGKFKTIIFSTYFVFEKDEILFLIDFHAAYERLNFNKLKAGFKKNRKRLLLFPEIIDIKKISFDKNIDIKIEILNKNGFEIEPIGKNKYQLFSVPDIIKESDEKILKEEIIAFLDDEEKIDFDYRYLIDKVIANLACKMSPKAFNTLDLVDIKWFINEFTTDVKDYHSCPHGRPTVIKMEKAYFDKRFFRIK